MKKILYLSLHKNNGEYVYASPEIVSVTGFLSEELIGQSPYGYMHKKDIKRISKTHVDTYENKIDFITWRIRRKDNEYVWVRTFTGRLEKNKLVCITYKLSKLQTILYKIFGV